MTSIQFRMSMMPNFWLVPLWLLGIVAVAAEPAVSQTVEAQTTVPRFGIEIQAILNKSGCNQGACHGNASGKGGFKLSLRGQDRQFDYQSLVQEHAGRRVNLLEPDLSLTLTKPTMGVAHEGGQRFKLDSPEYSILRQWIAAGAPEDHDQLPRVKKIRVTPADTILTAPDAKLQLAVIAEFSDGTSTDVTRWACYDPAEPRVKIDVNGQVTFLQPGETTILVRYLQAQQPVRVSQIAAAPDYRWEPPATSNLVDQQINKRLQQLRLEPSPTATEAQFLRRLTLDLLGVLPTLQEALDFVADQSPDKREKLIAALLQRPEYSELWALRWADILRAEDKYLDSKGVRALHEWLRASFASNKPLDQFARELVSTAGSTYDQPAANYYRVLREPVVRGEATAQVFLGIRLQCAKCHNHPFDRWSQDDYHQWTAVFAGIDYEIIENRRRDKNDLHEFIGEQIVQFKSSGSVTNPRTEKPAEPKLLGARETLAVDEQRLAHLAQWLTAQDNKQFARAMTNRLWYYVFGRGLVEPVDDFRASNPATHPELLEQLSQELIRSGYDQQHLLKLMLNSQAYQRSSTPNESNRMDELHYARMIPRRLPAETLLDVLCQTTGAQLDWAGLPDGSRAAQRAGIGNRRKREGSTSVEKFLRSFGKPPRLTNCECERSTAITVGSSFQLLSGPLLNELLTQPNSNLDTWTKLSDSPAKLIETIWWTVLSRPANSEEVARFSELLAKSNNRRQTIEDILWALYNSHEFQLKR